MPDIHPLEEEAALYVLGRLQPHEHLEFEMRLSQSSELRQLVRELEEGALALAMTAPRRDAPRDAWRKIEEAIAGETRSKVLTRAFWQRYFQNGWAAAAACLLGWLMYAWWINHGERNETATARMNHPSTQDRIAAHNHSDEIQGAGTSSTLASNQPGNLEDAPVKMTEFVAMQWQVVRLENQLNHLSQVITQQQAMLAESSRMKFFQLSPASGGGTGSVTVPVSPRLQQALLLAMTRELGWSAASTPEGSVTPPGPAGQFGSLTNLTGVDFVELQPAPHALTNSINAAPLSLADAEEPAKSVEPTNAIPGFVSGTNVWVALDTTIAPVGSELVFWNGTGANAQPMGWTFLGENPVVVAAPMNVSPANGGVTITIGTGNGSFQVLGQFPPPLSLPP